MIKGIFYAIIFMVLVVYGIHKGWHNNIASFGNATKPFADIAVQKAEQKYNESKKDAEKAKEVTNKVATEVNDKSK